MIKKTALALAALVAGVSAQAEDAANNSGLSVTVDLTYVTDYVFRGVQLGDASLQPSVEVAYSNFYAGLWHTSPISSDSIGGYNLSETDFYAGYGFDLTDKVKLDAGLTAYTYEGGSSNDTTEAYVGASLDVFLKPSLYYYYDFDIDSSTLEASIGYSIPLDAIKASIDLSGKYGWVSKVSTLTNEARSYGVVGAAIPFHLSETATLTVGIDYILNDVEVFDGETDGFVGKAGISIGF